MSDCSVQDAREPRARRAALKSWLLRAPWKVRGGGLVCLVASNVGDGRRMCMRVCMYVRMHACMHVCMYVSVYEIVND